MNNSDFIQANGIRLHYLDQPGGEPPIILLHGWTANAHAFDGLIEAGLAPRYHCVSLDLRGRGGSETPETGYSLQDHASDVIGLMDVLELKSACVVGHSYGGFLAMFLGAMYPERFRQIIVLEAASTIHPRNLEILEKASAALDNPIPPWQTYLTNLKQAAHFANWWDPAIEVYYRAGVQEQLDGTLRLRTRPHVLEESLSSLISEDTCKLLSQLTQPMLLLHAVGPFGTPGTPPIVTSEMALETARCAPSAQIAVMPGNHLTMLYGDNAPEVVRAITKFIEG